MFYLYDNHKILIKSLNHRFTFVSTVIISQVILWDGQLGANRDKTGPSEPEPKNHIPPSIHLLFNAFKVQK